MARTTRFHSWMARGVGLGALALAAALALAPAEAGKTPADLKRAAKAVSTRRLKKHLFYLAGDALEGREAGSKGGHRAALYLAEQYREAGLLPLGSEGFFQPFGGEAPRGPLAEANFVRVAKTRKGTSTRDFTLGEDFKVAAFSASGNVRAEVVFAGYGITDAGRSYDDYKDLDAKGKIVLVLDQEPRVLDPQSPFNGAEPTEHASLEAKAKNAIAHGARALIVAPDIVNRPDDKGAIPDNPALAWPPQGEQEPLAIPVIYASGALANTILRNGRLKLEKLQARIDDSLKPASETIKGYPLALELSPRGPILGGMKNVIACKPGSDPKLREEYIIISAHYDHVGYGTRQNSKGGVGQIHNGADDNGSGTSGLLELARVLEKLELRRSVLLMSFDAEEKGLVGSKYFAANPTVPLDNIVAILNMDMISRNEVRQIYIGGTGRNKTLDAAIERISAQYKLSLNPNGMAPLLRRSDQWSLMERGVPGLFFYGGSHNDYHTAGDDPEKSSLIKMKLITQVCIVFLYDIGNADKSPRELG